MSQPLVSVAAVTYRDLEQTRAFVGSVVTHTQEPYELVMVDNGSPKNLADYLESLKSVIENYTLIRNPSNLGIGPAMNMAMLACKTDYIARCDSDIRILSMYWTRFMREMLDANNELGAIGTAITGGTQINRGRYVETDLILSNCMMIHRRAIDAIDKKMQARLPVVRDQIANIIKSGKSKWVGYTKQLGMLLDYMQYGKGCWNFSYPYGVDDLDFSMLIRYSGYKLAKDNRVSVYHKDDSLRAEWTDERHRRVNEGFQIWRAAWEILEEFEANDAPLDYYYFPMNQKYLEEARRLQNA